MVYDTLRTAHLLCGTLALPMLVLYGVSAVQMAHSKWFTLRPQVTESDVVLRAGSADGRGVARELMASRTDVRGEITQVKATAAGFDVRITVPGMVHEVRYDRASGAAHVRTSVAGVLGMMNRLHHAAGLSYSYLPMRLWGLLVAVVSAATLGLALTGIWMWWLRKRERTWGLVLLGANLAFSVVVLVLLRRAGS